MTTAANLAQYANNSPSWRNRIINGAMVIDQRNAGASVTASATAVNAYTLDRWLYNVSVASKFTLQQNAGAVTPPAGFSSYLGCTSSSAYSVGAAENFLVGQFVEGFNFADLAWGTASAQTVTISFWVRSSLTGTFGGSLVNNAFNRSYPFSYTIGAANTWEQKTVTIAGDASGTWVGSTNGIGVRVYFSLGVGATISGTAGAWAGSGLFSATGATSVVGTSGATFYITGVQLEKGTTATNFEYRDYGRELVMCQRYYQQLGTIVYSGSYDGTTTLKQMSVPFLTSMRDAPIATITYVFGNGASSSTAVAQIITTSTIWDLRNINVATGVMYAQPAALSAEL